MCPIFVVSAEAYSKTCQTSKMEHFYENNGLLLAVNYFHKKTSTLHVWQGSENWLLTIDYYFYVNKRNLWLTHLFLMHPLSTHWKYLTVFWCFLGKEKGALRTNPANIYLFKFNNGNTRKRCEICSKITIKTQERRLTSFWYFYC